MCSGRSALVLHQQGDGDSQGPGQPGKTSFRQGGLKETREEETEGRLCPGEEATGRWAQAWDGVGLLGPRKTSGLTTTQDRSWERIGCPDMAGGGPEAGEHHNFVQNETEQLPPVQSLYVVQKNQSPDPSLQINFGLKNAVQGFIS